jgi:hypothetical protein
MQIRQLALLALLISYAYSVTGYAEMDAQSKADEAVAVTLFEYEGSDEFASYRVNEDGFVDIVFARNMPDKLYAELLTKLQNHPNIDGVLAGKGGPLCKIDTWKSESAETVQTE